MVKIYMFQLSIVINHETHLGFRDVNYKILIRTHRKVIKRIFQNLIIFSLTSSHFKASRMLSSTE